MNMLDARVSDIEHALDRIFPACSDQPDALVFEAARYSLLDGGKRIRPLLLLEFAKLFGVSQEKAMPFACALECIHTYSLIHDDMPCMDNDDMRRNRPTNHKVYGEAMALLAGDALLNRAYEVMISSIKASRDAASAAYIADCAGVYGMVGGQCVDLANEGKTLDESTLRFMHAKKTGALIRAACVGGAMLGTEDTETLNVAEDYARELGLAFQIIDDILDVEGDAKQLGKNTGADAQQGKNTFVSVYGLAKAKEMAISHTENAFQCLKKLPKSEFLSFITQFLLERKY